LFVTKQIQPGDVILLERPLVSVVLPVLLLLLLLLPFAMPRMLLLLPPLPALICKMMDSTSVPPVMS